MIGLMTIQREHLEIKLLLQVLVTQSGGSFPSCDETGSIDLTWGSSLKTSAFVGVFLFWVGC